MIDFEKHETALYYTKQLAGQFYIKYPQYTKSPWILLVYFHEKITHDEHVELFKNGFNDNILFVDSDYEHVYSYKADFLSSLLYNEGLLREYRDTYGPHNKEITFGVL